MEYRKGKKYQAVISSSVGPLGIIIEEDSLIEVDFLPSGTHLQPPKNKTAARVVQQLQQYFRDPRSGFEVPLNLRGTDFQKRVWQALQKIPSGKTVTYGELARRLHTSPRAIGGACRANPVPIIVPCHRVVSREGVGGFAGQVQGDKVYTKTCLLAHEGRSAP